jgi:hypothetical protein
MLRRAEGAMEREEGGRPLSGTVEMLAVEPLAAVENTGTVERGPLQLLELR